MMSEIQLRELADSMKKEAMELSDAMVSKIAMDRYVERKNKERKEINTLLEGIDISL